MSKEVVKINDFRLFSEIVKSLSRMSDGAKFTLNDCGLTIYAKNDFSKCEITSNSVVSENELSFCIGNLGVFLKILSTLEGLYGENSNSEVRMFFESPFLKIESRKFKTKLNTVEEDNIKNFIGTKVHTDLTPKIQFTTNSKLIRAINSHSFISSDPNSSKVYISTDPTMENNVVFATIGNDSNDLENSLTLELGLVNYGSMCNEKAVLNFDRLNILNILPSDEISVYLANERPVLVSKIQKNGKNDTFFNINTYVFLMVK